MITGLTHEQVGEFREAFSLFDKDGDGLITVEELASIMRSLGQNPTDDEVRSLIADIDQDNSGSIDFPEFLFLMARKLSDNQAETELLGAFQELDEKGNGIIGMAEFKRVLTSTQGAECLTAADVDEMLREAGIDGSAEVVEYGKIVKMMLAR